MTTLDLLPVPKELAGKPAKAKNGLRTEFRDVILTGVALLGISFGGFGTWAAVAPLSSAAIAPGVLVAASNNKVVQHLEGGIVGQILVKEGQEVAAGDTLIVLDPTRAAANVDILRGQLHAALALEARLLAEQAGEDSISFPDVLMARRDEADMALMLKAQENVFLTRKEALDGQITILRQRGSQLKEQIVGVQAQVDSQQRQIELIEDELQGTRELYEKGFAQLTRVRALEREASRLLGEKGEHQGEINRIRQQMSETDLQILQVQKQVMEEVAGVLRETQTQIFDLRERLRAAEDVLARTTIRAPESGRVVGLRVHTIGGVIPPGETLLEVVPVRDELVIESQIMVTDVDNVKVGQSADVHFTALPQSTTPVLTGTVVNISPDRMVDERSGAAYYMVRVVISEEERAKLGDAELINGMPADAYIKTGERTMLEYLVKPLTQVIERSFRES